MFHLELGTCTATFIHRWNVSVWQDTVPNKDDQIESKHLKCGHPCTSKPVYFVPSAWLSERNLDGRHALSRCLGLALRHVNSFRMMNNHSNKPFSHVRSFFPLSFSIHLTVSTANQYLTRKTGVLDLQGKRRNYKRAFVATRFEIFAGIHAWEGCRVALLQIELSVKSLVVGCCGANSWAEVHAALE